MHQSLVLTIFETHKKPIVFITSCRWFLSDFFVLKKVKSILKKIINCIFAAETKDRFFEVIIQHSTFYPFITT